MDERNPAGDEPIEDLEADADEAEAVKGGALRTADPCEGGE